MRIDWRWLVIVRDRLSTGGIINWRTGEWAANRDRLSDSKTRTRRLRCNIGRRRQCSEGGLSMVRRVDIQVGSMRGGARMHKCVQISGMINARFG